MDRSLAMQSTNPAFTVYSSATMMTLLSLVCYTAVSIALLLTSGSAQVSGPVLDTSFPDPSLVEVNGVWYSFATRTIGSTVHVPYATSPDFNTWTEQLDSTGNQIDALPTLPSWVDNSTNAVWAPDVSRLPSGEFIMYYSALSAEQSTKHCIGAATSSTIQGPYTPTSDEPLICPLDHGGAIDPTGFMDWSGQHWVIYKVDGTTMGHGGLCSNDVEPIQPTPLMAQAVAADGITLQNWLIKLMDNDGSADTGNIEAPSMVETMNGLVLFFSSGCFTSETYTVSYATAPSLWGPWTRHGSLLSESDGLISPGGASIALDAKHMVFHAYQGANRVLFTVQITVGPDLDISI